MPNVPDSTIKDFMSECLKEGLTLSSVLGEGGFGCVYAGKRYEPYPEDKEKRNSYAIKLAMDVPDIHDHLEREIRIQMELSHPNIVKIYKVISKNDQHGNSYKIIVMERLDMSLKNYLMSKRDFAVSEPETRYFIQQVVAGLLYIHDKGYAHRDLKPDNILMSKDPSTGRWILKICDFGFAKESNNLVTGLGTPNYMAPEIFINPCYNVRYGPEVDLWALGATVYLMLTGKFPFTCFDERGAVALTRVADFQLPGTFSPAARSFVSRLLTTKPIERMTFDQLRAHPFLLNAVSVTVVLPGSSSAREPPVLRSVLLSSDRLPPPIAGAGEPALSWLAIAGAVRDVLRGWGCCAPPLDVEGPDGLLAFTAAGERLDLRTAALPLAELRAHSVEAFFVPGGCGALGLRAGAHCCARPTDLSPVRAALPQGQQQLPCAPASPEAVAACREAARAGALVVGRVLELYHFAVAQCALAHRCIVLLERACTGLAARIAGGLRRGLARLARCRSAGPAARAFLYEPVPRDTAEIRDFNGRGRDVVARVLALDDMLRRYVGFDEDWAKYNAQRVVQAVQCLAPAVAALDAEVAAVLDTFTAYWNTIAREIGALARLEELAHILAALADVPDAAPDDAVLAAAERYSRKLSEVMALFPTWAVRPCEEGPQQHSQGGAAAAPLVGESLPAGAVALEECRRRVEALKAEKKRLEAENEALRKELREKEKEKERGGEKKNAF